ncbi:MAG: hypothetical protein JWQ79_3902 [Mucilaginibacter sp.]|jgi:hypothetical protein|nr:hypothetical protein [Mucilaginibacter sp.]
MTNNTKTFIIKRLTINNINDLEQLYELVYGRKAEPEYYLKKYNTAYTGAAYIGFIAYNKHHLPVSYYGVIPTFLWYNGRIVLAAQAADAMTLPQYRNTGLFTELAKNTFELCRNEGVRIIFGFPNQNSFPVLINKLKWHMTETMERFMIPVNWSIPMEKIVHKYPFLKPAYDRYKAWVLKAYLRSQQGISNSVLDDNYNGVFRDDKYLKYKTYSPTQVIQIGRSTLWIKLRDGLLIGDIAGLTDNFDHTLKKLISLSRRLGLKQIHFHSSPNTKLHGLFAQRYPAFNSFPVIFKDLSDDMVTDKIKFTLADIDIF